jgi:hypothetical protein
MRQREARSGDSEYPWRVRQDGLIDRDLCRGRVGGRDECAGQLSLMMDQKLVVAQAALDHFEDGCRLGQIDPPEVSQLLPNYRSGPLSLIVQVECP